MNRVRAVSVVVCTLNSIASIRLCLTAVRNAGVGEIIVVDANSSDGTREVAEDLADMVLIDPREGLGFARNLGIAQTTGAYVLNLGSDNVITREALEEMLAEFEHENVHGVGALTRVSGNDYLSKCTNIWWKSRFRPGVSEVIGTPTLMSGDLLRSSPFNPSRRFSDDSELCERWSTNFGSKFIISNAQVFEVGKSSWREIRSRASIYGISDNEVYQNGIEHDWTLWRRLKSLFHPLRVDYLTVVRHSSVLEALFATPFLLLFTLTRYSAWWKASRKN